MTQFFPCKDCPLSLGNATNSISHVREGEGKTLPSFVLFSISQRIPQVIKNNIRCQVEALQAGVEAETRNQMLRIVKAVLMVQSRVRGSGCFKLRQLKPDGQMVQDLRSAQVGLGRFRSAQVKEQRKITSEDDQRMFPIEIQKRYS